MKSTDIMNQVGEEWKQMSKEEKQDYEELSLKGKQFNTRQKEI